MKIISRPALLSVAVSAVILGACGESDLPEYHKQKLAEAELAQDEREAEAANNEDTFAPAAANEDTSENTDEDTNEDAIEENDDGDDTQAIEEDADVDSSTGEENEEAAEPDDSEETNSVVQSVDLDADYTLVFADDFEGDSLDFTRWKTALEWGPDLVVNQEEQYYVDIENAPDFGYNPFTLNDGILTISAVPTPDELAASANNQPWLSGVLSTASRFDMQYGYLEARMDLPAGRSLWSSLWMLSSDYNATELRPRIFVAEYDGGRADAIFHNYQYEDSEGAVRSPGQFQVDDDSLADGFHTVGLSWTPEDLIFYLNDQPRYRVIGDRIPQQAMYVILSLAVGGVWVDDSDTTTPDPGQLQIDYVRVYERNNN